jgi:hypothetical protein
MHVLNNTTEAVDDNWTIWEEVDNMRRTQSALMLHEEGLRRN